MTYKELMKRLNELSGNNVSFQESIIPGAKPIMGVRMPELRKLAKEIAKDDYINFLEYNKRDTFEEECLEGLVLGYAKDNIHTLLRYFEFFMPHVHDWAVCDAFCQTFKIAKKYQKETFTMLSKYFKSEDEFTVRIVAVMLLSHFNNDQYVDKVLDVLNNLKAKDYYAQMAVAWAVATVMAKYPNKCYSYLLSKENKLSVDTYNKSIQKMLESYRVSDEMKARLKRIRK